MKYNLTDIFENLGKVQTEDIPFEYDAVQIYGEEYILNDKSDVHMTLNNIQKGKAEVTCQFSASVSLACDRCLKEVPYSLDISAALEVYAPDAEVDEDERSQFVDGYKLDVDELILSEICLQWPSKILCKDDCKGICSVCGHDLNDGDCGCDRFVPNAAFAGLGELLKNSI